MKPLRIAIGCLALTLAFLVASAPQARAAAAASDNACNAAYSSGTWAAGDNGGSGFNAWTQTTTGGAGFYTGNSATTAGHSSPGVPCSSAVAWGMYAGGFSTSGNSAHATRTFTSANGSSALQVGQTFSIDMDNGGVGNTGNNGINGFSLQNNSGQDVFSFKFIGNSSDYSTNNTSSAQNVAQCDQGYTSGGLRVQFTMTTESGSTTQYTVKIFQPNTSGSASHTYTSQNTIPESGGQAITQVILYNSGGGSGGSFDLFFNNMSITCPDTLTIGTQPSAQTVCAGSTASFTVTISAGDSPTYQWRKNGTAISNGSTGNGSTYAGVTTATLSISSAASGDAAVASAGFDCVITDACGTPQTSSRVALGVNANPSISTSSLPNGTIGNSYSQTVAATGGTTPYTFSISSGSLPTSLTINSSTGVISGTYSGTAQTYTFTVQAQDNSSTHCTGTKQFTITEACSGIVALSPSSLPALTVGSAYGSQTISASGGSGPYTFTVSSGSLPSGLTMNTSGVISGTPTSHTSQSFTITATDSGGCLGTQAYTLQAACPGVTITTSSLPNGTVGTSYGSQTIQASGANGSYNFTVSSGSLPAGLSINSATGVISGTPTSNASQSFTITATDTSGCTGAKAFTVSPACPTITVSPSSLPNGTVGTSYGSQTISASGANGSYTFALTSGSLPAGLTLNSATGVVSGTPTSSTSQSFTITATDSSGCSATKSYTVTPVSAPSITGQPLATTVCSGSTATFTVTASGTAPLSYAWRKRGNGWGSSWNITDGSTGGGGSGQFIATSVGGAGPSDIGSSLWQMYAYGGSSVDQSVAYRSFPTTVAAPGTGLVTGQSFSIDLQGRSDTAWVTGGKVGFGLTDSSGTAYLEFQYIGVQTDWTIHDNASPSTDTGISKDARGLHVVITLTSATTYSCTIYKWASGGGSYTATNTITGTLLTGGSGGIKRIYLWNIDGGSSSNIYFNNMVVGPGADDNAGNYGGSWTSGATDTFGQSPLANGSTIAGATTAQLSVGNVTSASAGTYDVVVYNTVGYVTSSATGVLTVNTSPTISTASLPAGTTSTAYSQTIAATSGTTPYSFSITAGSLPAGLTMNTSGHITGTPTTAGTSAFSVTVTDSSATSCTGVQGLSIAISCATITVTPTTGSTTTLPTANNGTSYNQTISASGGTGGYSFSLTSGSLPTGLTLSTGGVISGTSSVNGTSTFTVTATDGNSCTGAQQYQITVATCPAISLASLTGGTVGTAYAQTATASGGTGPYTYSLFSGSLPTGLALNTSNGQVSGTPSASGTYTFTILATDNGVATSGCTGSQTYNLTFNCPTISLTSLTAGTVGTAYSQTVTASGGIGSYNYTKTGSLPTGLALNSVTGVLSGTPTASGTYAFTVTATDSDNCTGSRAYSLTFNCPAIALSSLTAGTVGTAYSQTVTASGGTAAYNYTKTSGSLPTGLALNSVTGVISGTPTASGTYTFQITATDADSCTGVQTYNLAFNCPAITITYASANNSSLPFGIVNVAYSPTNNNVLASGGTAPYTYSLANGTLPTGLTMSTLGVISGTPTAAGTSAFTLTATDADSCAGSQSFSITVFSQSSITGQPLAQTICSGSTATFTVTASGSTPLSYTWRKRTNGGWGASNAWQLNPANNSGTQGTYVSANNSTGCGGVTPGIGTAFGLYANSGSSEEAVRNFGPLAVGQSVAIDYQNPRDMSSSGAGTKAIFALRDSSGVARFEFWFNGGEGQYAINDNNPLAAPGTTGIPYSSGGLHLVFTLTAANTYNLSASNLNNGVVYTFYNRTLEGTTGNSISQIRLFYRNTGGGGTACQDFFVNNIDAGGYTDNATNAPYSGTTWANGNNGGDAPISGATSASYATSTGSSGDIYDVVAFTGYGLVQSTTASLSVNTSPTISTTSLPGGTTSAAYSQTVAATSGTTPYSFSISSGSLPAGLTLNTSGHITGTPTASGTSTFTVQVTDSSSTSCTATKSLSISITCATITVSPTTGSTTVLPTANNGQSYNQTVSASGGTGAYTFSLSSGTLPTGLTLNTTSGVISGTATVNGTSTFTVTATDGNSCAGSQQYQITVATCPAISLASLTGGTVGTAYSQTATASGGTGPYTYSVLSGSLPTGLALSTSTGLVSGTPTASGTYTFTILATDNGVATSGCTGSQTYNLTFNCPAISLASLPNGTVGTAYSQTATASGGTASYSYAKTSGSLPTGLALNTSTGLVSGTPTAAGTYTFQVTATDAHGCTGAQTYNLTFSCPTITVSGSMPNGTAGTAYSQTISASGSGVGGYNYTINTGSLPTGLSLNSSTGVVSGTPTASGTYTFQLKATDADSCSGLSSTYNVTISCPAITVSVLAVNNSGLPFGLTGVAYSSTNNIIGASNGTAPYSFSVSSGSLPTGLTMNTGGVISGAPSAAGTSTFTVTATDADGCANTLTTSITVGTVVSITGQPAATTVCSGSTASFTVTAAGTAPLSYAWRKNGVGWGTGNAWTFSPAACSGPNDGYYVGDPTACGGISPGIGNPAYGIYSANGNSAQASRNFSALQIGQSVIVDYQNPRDMSTAGAGSIALFGLNDASGNARFEFYFNGGDTIYTISDSSVSGQNSGIPYTPNGLQLVFTLTGTDAYSLQVSNLASAANYTYSGTLKGTAGHSITQLRFFDRDSNTGGTACQDFFFNVQEVGGYSDVAGNYTSGACGSTTWTNGANVVGQGPLSNGGSISGATSATLQIAGVSSADSGSIYSVFAYNAYGAVKSSTGTLTVNTSPTISTASLPGGTAGTAYSQTVAATGGTTPYSFSITSGSLPTGLTMNTSGAITGTPTATGTSTFTVTATDSSSTLCTGGKSLSITISCGTITVSPHTGTTTTLPTANNGTSYNQTVSASGGTGAFTFSLSSGSLPTGLTLSTGGMISGTSSVNGTSTFTVTATDGNSCTGSQQYQITVATCPAISLSSLSAGTVASAYSQTATASGGTGPYTYSILSGSLPTGLTLNSSSGLVSGTPTASGTYTFTILATDDGAATAGCTGSQTYNLTMNCPAISLTSLTGGTVNSAYAQTVTASGGTSPYSYAKTSGSLPTGLALNSSNGQVSGTPTASGTYTFAITATDAHGCTGSQTYNLTFACPVISVSPGTLPGGTVGVAYQYGETVSASGGSGGYTFSVGSGLPTGLTLSTGGAISGTPTASGSYTFTITATDSDSCSGSQTYNVSVCSAPVISGQPVNQTVCSGSSATFTVTASGSPSYAWRKRGSGWGGSNQWQFDKACSGTSGYYEGSSLGCTGVSPGIDTSSNRSFAIYANSGDSAQATRTFTALTVGQIVAVDYANPRDMSSSGAGTIALFALQDASGNNRVQFYFNGGDTDYTLNDSAGGIDSGIPYTAGGLHLVLSLTGVDTYNLTVTRKVNGAVYTFTSRTLGGTAGAGIAKLRFYLRNSGTGGTACQDFFFNSILVGGYDDNADNYVGGGCGTTTWIGGSNNGQGPISGATSASYTTPATVYPTDSGSQYDAVVYNSCGAVIASAATLTVNQTPSITTIAPLGPATVGTAFSQTISASGGTTPYTFTISSGSLPGGLTIGSSSGVVSGTPTTPGVSTFTVSLSANNSCSTSSNYTLTVNCATISLTASLANGTLGVSYDQTVTATGGQSPYSYSLNSGSLPTGLTLSTGGVVSGTPTVVGTYTFAVLATDANNCTGSQTYSVQIQNCAAVTVSGNLANSTVGNASYSQALSASGGSGSYTWTISSGSLPTGLTINSSSGLVSGTPTATGTYTFTVSAADNASACYGTKTFGVTITCGTISISPGSPLTSGTVGLTYAQTISASGGGSPYTFTISAGTLPSGLTLSTGGVVSGTPTVNGTYAFTVLATDTYSCTASKAYSLVIACSSITVAPSTLPGATTGVAYTETITTSGGTAPYSYAKSSGTLPTGLTLSTSGVVSGTPTLAGSYTFAVAVTDNVGCTGSQTYNISVCAPPSISAGGQPGAQTVCSGSTATFTVTASGSSPLSYAWRKQNTGWGGAWTLTAPSANSGFLITTSTHNNNGTSGSNGGNDIDTSGEAWGLYNKDTTTTEALRPLGGSLAVGQTFNIDMDNGDVNYSGGNHATVGFGLQNTANNNNRFEVYFIGGQSDYTIDDHHSAPYDSGIGWTRTGINIKLTLTGTDSYTVTITRYDNSTVATFSGTLGGTAGSSIDRVRLFYAGYNTYTDGNGNLFFNNMSYGTKNDDASNYTPGLPSVDWITGSDRGEGALSNGGSISGADTAQLQISGVTSVDATNYDVVVYNSCGSSNSVWAPLTVNARPTAVVSGTATICQSSSTTIQAALTGTGPWNVTWSDGTHQNGVSSSPATRSVSPSSTTTYTVTALTDANCTAQAGDLTGSAVVTVNSRPTAVVSGTATICQGNSTTIQAALTGASPWTVTWSDGHVDSGVSSSPDSRSVSPSSTTTYTVTALTDNNGCAAQSGDMTGSAVVTVTAAPTVTASNAGQYYNGAYNIFAGNSVQLYATTVAGGSYSWTGPNSFSSSSQNPMTPTLTASSPYSDYTYTVSVTANGCPAITPSTTTVRVLTVDSSGVPDQWKTQHSPYTASTPSSTVGANGMTLLQSYLAGVDPTDPTTALDLTNVVSTASGILTYTWNSRQDGTTAVRDYDVYALSGAFTNGAAGTPAWVKIASNVAPAGNSTSLTDDIHSITQRFYRVTIAGHTSDVATIEIAGAQRLLLAEGPNYISQWSTPGTSTLLSVLGTNDLPSGFPGLATTVNIWDQTGQSFPSSMSYWLDNGSQYGDVEWIELDSGGHANSTVLDPTKGMLVNIPHGSGTKTLYITGFVPTSQQSQSVQNSGYTFSSSAYPTPVTLANSGLATGLTGATHAASADSLLFWDAATGQFDIKVYYNTSTHVWTTTSGSTATNNLQPGASFLINRLSRSNNFSWTNPVPYNVPLQGP